MANLNDRPFWAPPTHWYVLNACGNITHQGGEGLPKKKTAKMLRPVIPVYTPKPTDLENLEIAIFNDLPRFSREFHRVLDHHRRKRDSWNKALLFCWEKWLWRPTKDKKHVFIKHKNNPYIK